MKIRFLAKPPGTDYEAGQVAEFKSNDWVEMTYAEKYLREGLAEEAVEETAAPIDGDGLRTDGPTLEEYVAARYTAEGYPPQGYADKRLIAAPGDRTGGKSGKKK